MAGSGVSASDLVLDVGAGTGVIVRQLLLVEALVIAIELHPRRAAELRRRFAGDDVRVVQVDASDLRLPRRRFSVVANPPFAITTSLLRRLTHPASRLARADLVVPHHVALRWASGRGAANDRWAHRFDATVTARVPRHAFHPQPPRSAAVLTIRRRG